VGGAAAQKTSEVATASLAACAPLLACPACRSELGDLAVRSDALLCRQCGTRFPLYRSGAATIPWMFRDPDGTLGEWRARFNNYLHASTAEQARLAAAASAPHCGPAAALRIAALVKAKEAQRRQIFDLLSPLGLDTPRASGALDRTGLLYGKLPRQQGLLRYHDNVFRDWAWENGENERILECLARVLLPVGRYAPRRALALGAGACRLPYDFHRRYGLELTAALDLNPLLLLLASRVLQGQTVPFYEFPVAPLDQASFAVLRACGAPQPFTPTELKGFFLVLGDGLHAPFKPSAFDTVLTPWYIDIVPQDFADCARTVNHLLEPGGLWLNTGSLAFFHRNEAWCYSEEEVLAHLRANGFEVLAAERTTVPYLHSPSSAHGRVERVLSFSARKVAPASVPKPTAYVPSWLRDPQRPVPDLDEFVVASASHLLKAQALSAIDGRRTLEEIAWLVAKRYGLQKSEARGAVERILLEIFEASTLGKDDDVTALE
jgi:hypothetical protein